MCGIVGYVGQGNASEIVFEGLRRLEYRGYDSAGIAVLRDGTIEVRRAVGKLDNLATRLRDEPLDGAVGIGHTRWATHGRPTETNAHPHTDCTGEIVVIHNGIVENYLSLRKRLIANGHRFSSETDTEVVPHLIEDHLHQGLDLQAAILQTLREIRGNHAIVVLSSRQLGTIYAARLGNAGGVVLGVGDGEWFIASDLPAILPYTRRVAFLDHGEVAALNGDGYRVLDLGGNPIAKTVQTVPYDPVSAAKGGYKHFMLKEICEQPRSLSDTISSRIALAPPQVLLDEFGLAREQLQSFRRVVLVACGTAWHACLVGKFLIEELARVPVEVDYADEFRYRDPLIGTDTLFTVVTQSGETVDVLVSMEEARRKGAPTLAIVNVVGSQATRYADALIYTHAGPEIGVASTKAFTSQLAALYLFALYLGKTRGTLGDATLSSSLQALARLPHQVGELLGNEEQYADLANQYSKCHDFLYLARGINYPIALEGALKLKEISYIHAEGYPAGEMKHGPIALIDEEMPVVVIAPQDRVFEKTVSNVEQVKARGGTVIAVVTEGDRSLEGKADHLISIPATMPHLTPILASIPLQLLAYHIAVRRGCDVDQPRNLAKSVTVE
ncbi:MAG: glutamine--fructose-6-phosphate transaminase (isomerizing) [Chloroflexi bacterium]|nr:glutamine--fructose-6-phosphate transaminase (isomerizing) [Chloroflexota bacterium]